MEELLGDQICQDDRFLQRQRQQLCRLLADEMKDAFFTPLLSTGADMLWDQSVMAMASAPTKDKKKR